MSSIPTNIEPTAEVPSRSALAYSDNVLFIDRKEREYLRRLMPGRRIQLRGGTISADDLVGRPEGSEIKTPEGERFVVVRPTFAQLIPNLPRKAQVIYPKDIGPILIYGDIFPGATVVEVGVGPGSLTMALLRAIGSEGRLVSYELREDHVRMAEENVARFHGESPNWTIKTADAFDGISEREVDRMMVDLPEPWRLIDPAAASLRAGGVLLAYLPTVLQVKRLADDLLAHGAFGLLQVSECLERFWHVQGLSIRPEHRMVAHTGFLVTARRLALAAE